MEKFEKMLASAEPIVLSIFRIIVGLLLFQYGVAKILKYPVLPYFANPPPLIYTAGLIELILGALLILGLLTRPVAFILCGEMAFAYFIGHFPKDFIPLINGGNAAILLCFSCLYFTCAGGGPWSVDSLMRKRG